ncbi:hypothetical protein BC937DRAFT_90453 [Endogone sp. FLAS-F59071]|nr:hypothetical protein BC937DRAFT_90453 [Endogone sp. FLAS-F59071]|eukprot:RUS22088.1 hypothetical protein BC937DRAFT_90453 [Endogone sp. FLAS-F59071]
MRHLSRKAWIRDVDHLQTPVTLVASILASAPAPAPAPAPSRSPAPARRHLRHRRRKPQAQRYVARGTV